MSQSPSKHTVTITSANMYSEQVYYKCCNRDEFALGGEWTAGSYTLLHWQPTQIPAAPNQRLMSAISQRTLSNPFQLMNAYIEASKDYVFSHIRAAFNIIQCQWTIMVTGFH